MNRKILLSAIGLLIALYSFGQDVPNTANIATPTGNAYQAGQLTSMPVNLFTGVPK